MAADQENKDPDIEEANTTDSVSENADKDKTQMPSSTESVSSFSLLDADTDVSTTLSTSKEEDDSKDKAGSKETPKKFATEEVKSDSDTGSEPEPQTVIGSGSSKNISSDEVKDWLKDVRPDTTKEQEKGGGRSVFKWLAVMLILLLVGGAIAGGVYYYKQNVTPVADSDEQEQNESEQPAEGEQPEEVPSPTPTPEEVDLTIFSINVLNGSGVAGEAGSVADILSEAGFSSPNAANADSQDFTDTLVEHKETVPQSVIDELVAVLDEDYTVEVSDELIEEEAEYDIVVTVGERNE